MNTSELENDLEQKLGLLKLSNASSEFVSKGTAQLRSTQRSESIWSRWHGGLAWAVCIALVVSLGSNLLLSSRSNINSSAAIAVTFPAAPTLITASLLPGSSSAPSQVVSVANDDVMFRFLCLTKTTLLMDNIFDLGELKGFGEWAYFEIPNNYKVNISLRPLRDWKTIGNFENGNILLDLGDGHQISMTDAGIGIASLKQGGPLPIYGNIETIAASNSSENDSENDADPRQSNSPSPAQNPILAQQGIKQANPYSSVSNVQVGVDSILDARTRKYFGAFIDNNECG
ncbi:MAG: hypothetical protein COA96_16030 [SAR86 cluster bacterium]|uniref:Uncharacterized protein n=1 Tax=SAR86 cluster bacterium TaxID=2030880 RepID=A0A2A5AMJ2_9GAMM|nr:MAG: hypothetical protein COA96_16030 [SAR86 cluster bacterium]